MGEKAAMGHLAALRERVLGTCGLLAFGASLCLLGPRNKGDSKHPEQAAGWRAVTGLLGLLPLQLLFWGHPVGSGARAVSLKMRWSDSCVLTLAGWYVCVCVCVCVCIRVHCEVERQHVLGTEIISGKRKKRAKCDCFS